MTKINKRYCEAPGGGVTGQRGPKSVYTAKFFSGASLRFDGGGGVDFKIII